MRGLRPLAPLLVVLLAATALPTSAAPAPASAASASPVATDVWIDEGNGVVAHGLQALPLGACQGVVVIDHGIDHNATDHAGHLEHVASEGWAAIAMDYRGPETGFPLEAGRVDTIAAARYVRAECPTGPAVLFSVSMGTAVAGPVLATLPGFFTEWVDSEGLSMLAETWAEATAISPANAFAANASASIEAECGGTPATQPQCYHDRSAALRAPEFQGLRGVVLLHAVNDGLVPYDQGREMEAALKAVGVPTAFFTVLRGQVGEEGTTITGYAGANVDGLAGHGDESDDGQTLTHLSLEALDGVLARTLVPSGQEMVMDRDLGTLP
jgi:acetyl esterase/lipase